MRFVTRLRSLWWNLAHREQVDAALDDEVRAYVELMAAEHERAGMSPADARRAALIATRGVDNVKEATRDAWMGNGIAVAARELRYALRSLRRSPAFAAIAIATLGIGIGGATAIFTAVEAVFLRPLSAVSEPERLISAERIEVATSVLDDFSYQDYRDLRAQATTLAGLAAYNGTSVMLKSNSGSARAWVSYVSDNFFDVLRVRPVAGRFIDASDGVAAGANPVVVLGFDLWQQRFGGDPGVIGSTVQLDLKRFTVIGVAPPKFIGAMRLHRMELWIPFGSLFATSDNFESRGWRWLRLVGRLAPAASVKDAQRELSGMAAQLASAYPVNKGRDIRVFAGAGMTADEREEAIRLPRLLTIAVSLLLLIACANVAGLQLVRAAAKRRELATRLALGASRAALVRQRFVEGGVLAVGAAVLGTLVAQALVRSASIANTVIGMSDLDVGINWRVLGASLAIACVTATLMSIAPALQVSRTRLGTLIRDGGGGAVGIRSRGQRLLVVVQVAASLVLLSAASTIYGAVQRLRHVDPGFDPRGVTYAYVRVASTGYDSVGIVNFYRELVTRARSEPGITGAALTSTNSPASWAPRYRVFRRGEELPPDRLAGPISEGDVRAYFSTVSPGWFDVMRIPLLTGRDFTEHDDDHAPPVAVISRRLAQQLWPNQSALGKSLAWPSSRVRRPPLEIVGVVADTRHASLADPPAMVVYRPFAQTSGENRVLVLRGLGESAPTLLTAQRLVTRVSSHAEVDGGATLVEHIDDAMQAQRVATAWIGVFGVIALLLAAIGLYGVIAQTVLARTRELAVRAALGATPRGLLALVVGDGIRLAIAGVVVGAIVSLSGMQFLRKQVVSVELVDARVAALAVVALAVAMLAASYLPARWAARLNPIDALRSD